MTKSSVSVSGLLSNYALKRLVLAALLIIATAQEMIGAVVFFDKRAGAIEDKAIVLNDREFQRGNINKIAQEFLGATKDKRLCRLTIATSENDVMSSLCKHTGNPTYATTVGEISAYNLPRASVGLDESR